MLASLLADLVLVVHFALVLFAVVGGFLVLWRRWIAWLHLPYVAWAAAVNLVPFTCPLTPLEVALRRAAGDAGYEGGFIAHYLTPIVYPDGMSEPVALFAGIAVLVWNALLYGFVYYRRSASSS